MKRDEKIEGEQAVDDRLLRDFKDGKLDEDQVEQLALLIESSPELQDRLGKLSSSPFSELLKRLRPLVSRASTHETPVDEPVHITHSSHSDSSLSVVARNNEPSLALLAHSDGRGAGAVSSPGRSEGLRKGNEFPTPLAEALAGQGYELQKEIARGGMGVVYLAKNLSMGRMEVLKVLNEKFSDKSEARERFDREVRSVSKLGHPSIVIPFKVFTIAEHKVFAMEFVPGENLHDVIIKQNRQKKHIPIPEACELVIQLCQALQHAHEQGMVHRDIKPSNIMIYRSEGQFQAKILDFGLARFSSEQESSGLTQAGQILGTPEYIAPEQLMDAAKADIRADIYSLGCTFYHMLTGQLPHRGTHGEILLAQVQREPTPVNLLRQSISPELAAVVAKMMAKEPHKRFQTPKEVVEAIRLADSRFRKSSTSADSPRSIAFGNEVQGETSPASTDGAKSVKNLLNRPLRGVDLGPIKSANRNPRFYRQTLMIWIGCGVLCAVVLVAFVVFPSLLITKPPQLPEMATTWNEQAITKSSQSLSDKANVANVASSKSLLNRELLRNGGCEDKLIEGKRIPGWTVGSGDWKNNSNRKGDKAYEGRCFFFPGVCDTAELLQEVSIAELATSIDRNEISYEVRGMLRSLDQKHPDSSEIIIEFFDATAKKIGTPQTTTPNRSQNWKLVQLSFEVPSSARTVRITLKSIKNKKTPGTHVNNGYFDAVSFRLHDASTLPKNLKK